jgi:hypothetical protein
MADLDEKYRPNSDVNLSIRVLLTTLGMHKNYLTSNKTKNKKGGMVEAPKI